MALLEVGSSLTQALVAIIIGIILVIVARAVHIENIINTVLYVIGAILLIIGLILLVLYLFGVAL